VRWRSRKEGKRERERERQTETNRERDFEERILHTGGSRALRMQDSKEEAEEEIWGRAVEIL
jgi:hypothetical protein